jgi:hypothetical protein
MSHIFVDQPGTGKTILYNSLYGSLTVWDPDEVPQVRRILAASPVTQDGDSPIWAVLVDQKHLIDDNAAEFELIEARKRAGMHDANRLDVVIMPTQPKVLVIGATDVA